MTTKEIQHHFPHVCVGYGCAVCWWVDGRREERSRLARERAALRARLERLTSAWREHVPSNP